MFKFLNKVVVFFLLPCGACFGVDDVSLSYLVDQVSQGMNPSIMNIPHKNLDDPENVIPEIPKDVLDDVLTYLNSEMDQDVTSIITEANCRDYLNAAKYCDLIQENSQRSTFPFRFVCFLKSCGKIHSLEAFTYRHDPLFFDNYDANGNVLPNKKFELYEAGQLLQYVPEWMELQKQIINEVIGSVLSLSTQLGYEEPKLILFNGTYGSGKSYQVQHNPYTAHLEFKPNALFNGVLSTDSVKKIYTQLFPIVNSNQVHYEGVAMRLQIVKALFRYYPQTTIIQEAVLATESSIMELFALAETNHSKIKLVDTDVDLEIACLRILTRDPSKGDSIPNFRAIVANEKNLRTNRALLHQKVKSLEEVESYELLYSEKGEIHLIAHKSGSDVQILPGQEERFLRALTPTSLADLEAVANRIITKDDCLIYGDRLEQFVGMKLEDVLLKLSQF